MRKRFDENDFHDCFLMSIDFSHWQEEISMTLWCPGTDGEWEVGRYLKIYFLRVLFFGLEVAVIGELGSSPPLISNILLQVDSVMEQKWKNRIDEFARPSRHYPNGVKSPFYSEIYHFSIDSVEFRRLAFFLDDDSFQILCRDFQVQDVSNEAGKLFSRYNPARIESG